MTKLGRISCVTPGLQAAILQRLESEAAAVHVGTAHTAAAAPPTHASFSPINKIQVTKYNSSYLPISPDKRAESSYLHGLGAFAAL